LADRGGPILIIYTSVPIPKFAHPCSNL